MAFPTFQFASGSMFESMDACTIGTSLNVSPNMSLNGTKTPWSSPGPENPRPSSPLVSATGVVRARYPAYTAVNTVGDLRQTSSYLLVQLYHPLSKLLVALR
jgi:hypothetical protein